MPDGVQIPGGPVFIGFPQPADVPCDPTGSGWRGPPGPVGPQGVPGTDGGALSGLVNVTEHGAKGDGTTDDTAAIQAVLNAYAGKATVFVPDTGSPYMCFPLVPPNGTDLLILGTLKLLPSSPNALINIPSSNHHVTLRGNGVLDGNGSAQVHGIGNVYCNLASNIRISGLTIQNTKEWSLAFIGCSDVVVDGVTVVGGYSASGFSAGCDNCWLTNCTIDGPSSDIGFSFYGGTTNSGAIGNTFRNAGIAGSNVAGGISILADGGQPAPCKNIVITGNLVYNSYGAGITVDNGTGASGLHDGIVISNNRCYGNGRGNSTVGDIGVDHCTNVLVVGNQSAGLGNGAAAQYGLYSGNSAQGVSFIGNQIYNTGQGGAAGVGLYSYFTNILTASGNFFYQINGAAMGGTAGLQCAYIGNYCDNPVTLITQSDTIMSNVVTGHIVGTLPANAANDAAAAAAGVPPGGEYRNGSVKMIRVA